MFCTSVPVVLTPEQVSGGDSSAGKLDGDRFVLTKVDLNAPEFSSLRVAGHEFVVVGVTRGGTMGDSAKILNPASATDLEHAVMRLDLGSGVGEWTLGSPVSVTYS